MTQSRREALRRQQQAQQRAKRVQRIIVVGAISLAVVVAGVFGYIAISQFNQPGAQAAAIPVNATPERNGIIVNPGKYQPTAPKIELFIDYQCPACKRFEDAFGATLDDMATKGEVQLIYRTMTIIDGNARNDSSLLAGTAAACADNVGRYSAYHNTVFTNQPTEGAGYTSEQLRATFASSAGITGEALATFQQCYDTRTTTSFVEGTNSMAANDGVSSTPTLRKNGQTMDNSMLFSLQPDAFRQTLLAP